jgi:hypothetical protein
VDSTGSSAPALSLLRQCNAWGLQLAGPSRQDRLIEAWLPLTFAVNSINRSMGLHDLYPFVLSAPAIVKLAYVHECILTQAGQSAAPESALHGMIAGLRQRAASRLR